MTGILPEEAVHAWLKEYGGSNVSVDDNLADELKNFVKKQLSAHEYPREIQFIDQLPKTPSGKIQRFLLRKD